MRGGAPGRYVSRGSIIKQTCAAYKIRDLIYGFKARPLPRLHKYLWSVLVGHFPGRGRMYYREMFDVARAERDTIMLGAGGYPVPDLFQEDLDIRIRKLFCAALVNKAREIERTDPDRGKKFRKGIPRGKKKDLFRDAILNGVCPSCGMFFPTTNQPDCHGYRDVTLDGKGGLTHAHAASDDDGHEAGQADHDAA